MKKINKNIIALGFVSFFTDMASNMVTTVLPIYIVFILKEGVDKLGYILAIATVVSYGFRFIFGYLSDRYQIIKPFVVLGYIISTISKPLLYFSSSWQSIALLRAVERLGKATRSATKDRLIGVYSKGSSAKGFSFHKMMDIAGEMFGAIIVFLVFVYFGKSVEVFKSIFAWTLLPGILAVIIVIFFVDDVPYKKKEKKKLDFSKDKSILPLIFSYFAFIFFMFNDSFFIVKAKEFFELKYIPLFIIMLTFIQTISSYMFGILIDKIGNEKVLILSYIFGFISMLSLYFHYMIISFIFLGLFLVASINSLRSYISDKAINKATVFGFLYAGVALFNSLGSVAIGEIWQKFGSNFSIFFSLSGIFFIIILNLSGLVYKR